MLRNIHITTRDSELEEYYWAHNVYAYNGLVYVIQTSHVSAADAAAAAADALDSATGRSPAAYRALSPPTPYNIATLTRIATGRGRARSCGRDGSGRRCGRCLVPAPPPPCDTHSVPLAASTLSWQRLNPLNIS